MSVQNNCEEEKQMNLGLCMSAGIETPNDEEDQTRFQRRHFPNKTTSDIFFCDSPLENKSRKSADNDNIYVSAGVDTRYNDQKQSERRHFHLSTEDGTMTRDYPDQDEGEQIDSSGIADSRESIGRDDYLSEEMDKHNANPKLSEKRHFHLSSEDGTMISDSGNQNNEDQVDSAEIPESRKSTGRDDYMSEEMDKRNIDQQQSEKRHFYVSSEDGIITSDFANREGEEVESSGTPESKETEEEEDSDQKKTQRRHFHDKTSSNIFFCDLPVENMSIRDNTDPSDFRKRKG